MKFLSSEEVFSLDDLEDSAFVDYGPRICVIDCYCAGALVKSLGKLAKHLKKAGLQSSCIHPAIWVFSPTRLCLKGFLLSNKPGEL